jgi:hypothetical protein
MKATTAARARMYVTRRPANYKEVLRKSKNAV